MDGEHLEGSVRLPRLENAPAVGVDLDSADATVTEQQSAEDTPADAREQVEFAHHSSLHTAIAASHATSANPPTIQ